MYEIMSADKVIVFAHLQKSVFIIKVKFQIVTCNAAYVRYFMRFYTYLTVNKYYFFH